MRREDSMRPERTTPPMSETGALRTCVCPGSYDPVTNGHLDIIRRAGELFGRVCVGVLDNAAKHYMFSADQREKMLREALAQMPQAQVVRWSGLLVGLLDEIGSGIVVRGVRSSADLAAEQQIAAVNRLLRPGTETVLLTADSRWQPVSSTVVRELIVFGADISPFVPPSVLRELGRQGSSTR